MQQQSALSNIRVLDFSRVLAGPICTMTLGDLGAEIIKIENPVTGDDTRTWGPPWADNAQSAYFIAINRNKRSVTLNLKTPKGQQIARELALKSHVIVENFRPGEMAKFGLDYASLKEAHPTLIYCSITGFGQTGLYSNRPGYDYVIQAMSGLMSITGPPDGASYKVGVAVSDVFTGLHACNAIQAALRYAEQTGQGQYIDMALLDSQLAALVNITSNVLISGNDAQKFGNQHPNIVPYQTFYGSDGEFVLAAGNDRQFKQLCLLINHPEIAEDSRFLTNPDRVKNRDALIPILNTIFKTKPCDEWIEALLSIGIPAGPINTIQTALNDPHVRSRNMIESIQMGDSVLELVASPIHLSKTPPLTHLPPPLLGEHTREVLEEMLKYDTAQIDELYADSII